LHAIFFKVLSIIWNIYIFSELWQEKNTPTMLPLPCYEVALENKTNAINSLLQKESIVALVGWVGLGRPFELKNVSFVPQPIWEI